MQGAEQFAVNTVVPPGADVVVQPMQARFTVQSLGPLSALFSPVWFRLRVHPQNDWIRQVRTASNLESTRRFSYGPRWRFLLSCFGVGIVPLVLGRVQVISGGVAVALSILPLALALIGGLRRLLFPRFIETDEDALSVCSGFLQLRITRIPFIEIEDTWELTPSGWSVLYVRTRERKFEINSKLLPERPNALTAGPMANRGSLSPSLNCHP